MLTPKKSAVKELNPEQLLLAVDDPSRFLSTDLITERIIKKDPSLLLIDVRPAEQYKVFSLQGAVNIPLSLLFSEEAKTLLGQEGKEKVFFSNDDILADQAWQICKRIKMNDIFVMKGGVNFWFNTIMKDNPPNVTDDSKAQDLYTFRKAARQYFMGNTNQSQGNSSESEGKKEGVNVVKKTTSKSSGGGC